MLKLNELFLGDCLDVLKDVSDNSIDAIVTDPPYFLNFMNKKWDSYSGIDPAFGNWFAGFVDGEGCFRIQKAHGKSSTMYTCQFQIKLRKDDELILQKIKRNLGFGKIQYEKGDELKKDQVKFIVQNQLECIKLRIIFEQFPLRAKKQKDFIQWSKHLNLWIKHKRGQDKTELEESYEEIKEIRKYENIKSPMNEIAFFHYVWAKEILRVLKPGGYILVFGGTKTYHRLVQGIEDAGFEIRDQLQWIYGGGFPKSQNISKMIDKLSKRLSMFQPFAEHYKKQRILKGYTHNEICEITKSYGNYNHGGSSSNWEFGVSVPTFIQWKVLQPLLELSDKFIPLIERIEVERKVTGKNKFGASSIYGSKIYNNRQDDKIINITESATEEAKQLEGWGTALKPAHEPIVLARKSISEKTIAENVLKWGTGGINIDECKIGNEIRYNAAAKSAPKTFNSSPKSRINYKGQLIKGRWPANILLDREAGKELDKQSGITTSGVSKKRHEAYKGESNTNLLRGYSDKNNQHGGTGGASRFFKEIPHNKGRWPANIIIDDSDEVLDLFESFGMNKGQKADLKGTEPSRKTANCYGEYQRQGIFKKRGDSGSAARFYYCAKVSKKERNQGLKLEYKLKDDVSEDILEEIKKYI